jgi:PAS domain S-box-containing protein
MQLKFDWVIVLENLQVGILVTDVQLKGPEGPRIIYANRAWIKMTGYDRAELSNQTPRLLQGPKSDRTVLRRLREDLEARRVFHGQTWNYRKSGEPFMMNWYCYAIYGERGKPIYYVAEQRDVTEIESLRMRERLARNPCDREAIEFFGVIEEYQEKRKKRLRG